MLKLSLRSTLTVLSTLLAPSLLGCDAEPPADEAADRRDRNVTMLEVDARAPSDVSHARFALFVGDIGEPPASLDAIESNADFAPMLHRRISLGGRDANRPAKFREVDEDTYTVCVAFGRTSGSREAQEAKFAAAYASVGGGGLSAEKIKAAAAALEADPTFIAPKIDWSATPVRCRVVEVTADAASRHVTLE